MNKIMRRRLPSGSGTSKQLKVLGAAALRVRKKVEGNELFLQGSINEKSPEWGDLLLIATVVNDVTGRSCQTKFSPNFRQHLPAIIERALPEQTKLATLDAMSDHLAYLLEKKVRYGYEYRYPLASFLGRLAAYARTKARAIDVGMKNQKERTQKKGT